MLKLLETEGYVLSSLYKLLGPLGVLIRITGQFPVHASMRRDCLLLKMCWLSPATLWHLLTSILPVASTIYESVSLPIVNSETIVHDLFVLTQLLITLVCFSTGWAELFELIDDMEVFDSQLHTVPILTRKIEQSKGFSWIFLPFGHLLWAFFLDVTFNRISLWSSILKALFFVPHVLQTVLFCFFCTEVTNRISRLQTSWLRYLQVASGHNLGKCTLRLDQYRTLHSKLMKCAASLSSAFGLRMAAICLTLFSNVTFFTYHLYAGKPTSLLLLEIFWFILLVIWICHYSSILRSESYSMVHEAFYLKVAGRNECLRYQLDLLVLQINRSKVRVCVPGLVVFSRELIGSFVSVLVTYFILATQVAVQVGH